MCKDLNRHFWNKTYKWLTDTGKGSQPQGNYLRVMQISTSCLLGYV